VTHYTLDYQTGSGPYAPLCDDAIPLTGVIDTTGAHLASPSRLTFACSDGAAHKCARFGYPGGRSRSALLGVHPACMQMVTADDCANGLPNTRVGTSIEFYDNAGVHQITAGTRIPTMTVATWPPNTTDYYFEAAFQASHTVAVCTGKKRWPLITNS